MPWLKKSKKKWKKGKKERKKKKGNYIRALHAYISMEVDITTISQTHLPI